MGKRVLVGMSGGVDSSVAAALLVEQGYEVIGITLNVWPRLEGIPEVEREDACCALGAVEDARRVANRLGIPYYVLNFRDLFEERVIRDFVQEYQRGRTPNPCIRCNQFIKFDALLARAIALEADYVATGHYARIEHDPASGRYLLRKAADPAKDQSYVLYVMTQDRLARTLLPLGELAKSTTRRLAAEWKLPVANKPESQEICFVPFRRYAEFVERYAPQAVRPGAIVDRAGRTLGRHQGVAFHTIGQRRGLGIAASQPLYVTALDPATNTVVVGPQEELLRAECVATEVNLIALEALETPRRVQARIRYRAETCEAEIAPDGEARVRVTFAQPQRAVTPGQAIVFYDGDVVVGGGTIADA
ncbi:MAG: tRNA 2-thiouridine(34) synthase MnmA [Chloroflexi bacterium]|nr:tRNA 2-thiouridine(34) synthase MnmA [Chloroflexota bacterium]